VIRSARVVWALALFLALIGIAVVARRMSVLYLTEAPQPGAIGDFYRYKLLTTVHILPGFLFMVLGPLQFVRRLRVRHPLVHRWVGRGFLVAALIVGVTALAMGPLIAIGGPLETAATTVFGLLFLFALAKAFLAIRRRKVALHREWMIRGFAIGLAVATIRPIIGFFFATSRLTGLGPHQFFGIAFWIGFTLQTLAAESWIRYTRQLGVGVRST
jgi:uncharacterized membrane protein